MRVTVRSEALAAAARVVERVADAVRGDAATVAGALARAGSPVAWRGGVLVLDPSTWGSWARVETRVLAVAGPTGLWGHALALDTLAGGLRSAARAYEEVEGGVAAVLTGVSGAADAASRYGWFVDGAGAPSVRAVPPTATWSRVGSAADLLAAGDGLDGGRVRVIETAALGGGSAWVVVVPGTQEWSGRAGSNPFDLTTDVRAVTGAATVAAAGVDAALVLARSGSARSRPDDPVLLVGHSQGGILAAALAGDAGFARRHRVTHVVTSGAPVGLFPVPPSVRVLSVQHADDPVHRLDLTPNPAGASWVTVEAPPSGRAPLDPRRHALEAHVRTLRAVEEAPRGTLPQVEDWRAGAGSFVGVAVLSVSEIVVERPGPAAPGARLPVDRPP
ncbi:hypothetical protein ACK8HX_11980 [Oryzobacter sp. R7]|uniref:hypothetical protein n=1 Tax=Oryzobacter faecalis TaxID=3388656 RepID=UPI00398CEAB3